MRNRVLSKLLLASLIAGSSTVAAAAADGVEQAERVAVGQEAPALSLPGSDHETHALADLRGKSNVVLVFFRGTW